MRLRETALPGVVVIEPVVHGDERGFFLETWHRRKLADLGLDLDFVQDNHSSSGARILRGLHAQVEHPQGKLVRVTAGAVLDVAVDIRPDSETYRRWVGVELSAGNFHQLWIPPGFAHGFCVLGDRAEVQYKCTAFYDADDEISIAWNDPAIGIEWPIDDPVLSARDRAAPLLGAIEHRLRATTP